MSQLVINPALDVKLSAIISHPSHGLALIGQSGLGKKALASYLTERLLNTSDLTKHPHVLILMPDEAKTISIDEIRRLDKFISLKTLRPSEVDRVVIICDAQYLSREAQNALLKTLEEPPKGTVLILTVSSAQALLPTVRSRLTLINVTAPSQTQLRQHFKVASDQAFDQAYAISGGAPGLLSAILNDEAHPLKEATNMARQVLSSSTYQRLILADRLSKQRDLAVDTINILQQMARLSLKNAQPASAKQWQQILSASYQAAEALQKNAQAKLVLVDLMINLATGI